MYLYVCLYVCAFCMNECYNYVHVKKNRKQYIFESRILNTFVFQYIAITNIVYMFERPIINVTIYG